MKKEIVEKLHDGLGALCFFPPSDNSRKWAVETAKQQGKDYFDYVDELQGKYPELSGFLPVDAAYAESRGYDLDEYFQALLNGASKINSQRDIDKWLKSK